MNDLEHNSFSSKELVDKYLNMHQTDIKRLTSRNEEIDNEIKLLCEEKSNNLKQIEEVTNKLRTICESIETVNKFCSSLNEIGQTLKVPGNLPIVYKTYFDIFGCDYQNIVEDGIEYCIITKIRNVEEEKMKK